MHIISELAPSIKKLMKKRPLETLGKMTKFATNWYIKLYIKSIASSCISTSEKATFEKKGFDS